MDVTLLSCMQQYARIERLLAWGYAKGLGGDHVATIRM
jgi:hypothetical protein